MMWFWLNIPLAVAFFAAWCGIPLFMVLRYPDWGSAKVGSRRSEPKPAGAVYGEPRERELALPGARR